MKSFRDALSEVRSLETHPLVKKARKAHKDGVWDGNVDKEGNPIVHINGRPHTVKEAEELDEASFSRPGKGERIIGDSKFEILKYPSGLYSINFVNVRDGDIFIGKEDLLRFQKFMTKVKV